MTTHLPNMPLPTESTLDITIRVTQPFNVTSFCARQRVTQYVMQELSTQFGGDAPELTVGERVYWSVPVVFALPGRGVLGRLGTLRVEAGTGELLTDPQTEQEMLRHAEQLAQRTARVDLQVVASGCRNPGGRRRPLRSLRWTTC